VLLVGLKLPKNVEVKDDWISMVEGVVDGDDERVLVVELGLPYSVKVDSVKELCVVGKLGAVVLKVWVLLVELGLLDNVEVELTVLKNAELETVEDLRAVDKLDADVLKVWVLLAELRLPNNVELELKLSENVEVETVEKL